MLIGAGVALAVSDGGVTVGLLPVFSSCALLAYAVNWRVFIPSNAAQTEKYFDLTRSITYVTVTVVAVILSGDADARVLIVHGHGVLVEAAHTSTGWIVKTLRAWIA